MSTAHLFIVVVASASLALMLARPRGIAEVWWASGGAALLVASRLVPLPLASRAIGEGADVYFFLAGMMLLSELAREEGVFDWLAAIAVRNARGSSARLFTTVYALGTVVTIFMSNDATAVVLTPAILAAVRKARVPPLPCLFVCAFIANAASFVLPISNPANLVVFHDGTPPLGKWFAAFGLPSFISITTTYAALRWTFRRELRCAIQGSDENPEPATLSRHGRLVVVGLALVAAGLLVASARNVDLGLPTCVAALVVTGAVCAASKRNPVPLARAISWSTLVLVAGLFVMVDAVQSVGALDVTKTCLDRAAAWPPAAGAFVTSAVVGVLNNVFNNLPLGLIAGATIRASHPTSLLTSSVLIGVDLGPNLSTTGSLATILWLLALRREGLDVGFWAFLKIGAIAMPIALGASIAGELVVHTFAP